MSTSAASMLLEFSALNVAAHKSTVVAQSSGGGSRGSWNGLRAGVQVGGGGARAWREVKREVGSRARVCAVAELFESEVLGTDGEGAVAEEEAVVKAVKPKTGKAALLLKRDRVSSLSRCVSLMMESFRPKSRFSFPLPLVASRFVLARACVCVRVCVGCQN